MKRLVDLNRGALFEDTTGLVGSAPFKLGDQRRQGPDNIDMNRRAVYHHTRGVGPSKPLHMGKPSLGQERERLRTSYSQEHGYKSNRAGSSWGARRVKASSKGLMCGTNEEAEDLTGQRAPVSSSRWRSECQDKFKGTLGGRPSSAPHFNPRQISLMDHQEPVFHHTKSYASRTHQMQELYPFKEGVASSLQDLDVYQTTYSFNHRPFNRAEQVCGPFWSREKRSRPWLESPKTNFSLQCREISREAQLHPSEAALATLPHYLHPGLAMERSEVQAQYRNPFQAKEFYHSDPTNISKPLVAHLQQTCLV